MKTLAYCRVSSLGQAEHGQSLEAQRADVARYCARHGLPEPQYFVEAESGGGTGERRVKQTPTRAALLALDPVTPRRLIGERIAAGRLRSQPTDLLAKTMTCSADLPIRF